MYELTDKTNCVCVSNGVEIWLNNSDKELFLKKYSAGERGNLIEIAGEFVNTSHILGVFTSQQMDALTRRKNGQWFCDRGTWHNKGEKCDCPTKQEAMFKKELEEATKDCKLCNGSGMIDTGGKYRYCDCRIAVYEKYGKDLYKSK